VTTTAENKIYKCMREKTFTYRFVFEQDLDSKKQIAAINELPLFPLLDQACYLI